ncbi:MAG: flagellar biosynthesis protein FlgD [Defluviitaleaceae bacterium]|nr:flagellar biosynthesis protein FlgD [Defluviitaleaceae bacterium]
MSTFTQNGITWTPTGSLEAAQAASKASKAEQREVSNSLDKNAFLSLLITQLRYQDPLNPMDDTQFVAQMAQFTSLEQMQNMNKSISLTQAYGMIGKQVSGAVRDDAGTAYDVTGAVESVSIKNGEVYLEVNGSEMRLEEVKKLEARD